MAAGSRSHLLSSIPNWDETQMEPLLREAPWNHRSWCWNHPIILRPNSDHPVTLKELGSAFLITGCTSSGHLWPGIRFWTPRELTPETTLSSRGDLCLMGRQTNTRKSCCSMGFKQEIMGIQSAKIKETRELIAAAGQCSWQNSPFQIHDQTMSKATTGVTWSCYALRLKGKTATFIKFHYGPCASPKWSIAMSIHNTVLKIITGARAV